MLRLQGRLFLDKRPAIIHRNNTISPGSKYSMSSSKKDGIDTISPTPAGARLVSKMVLMPTN